MKSLLPHNLILFAAIYCPIAFASPEVGNIEATAYRAEDGRPYEGVLVSVKVPDFYGRHPTDVNGKYEVRDVPVGAWLIEAHCPSKTGVGREILNKAIRVRSSQSKSVEIAVPKGFCDEPDYTERAVTIDGYFSHGFEHSNLSPCDPDALNLSKNVFFESPGIWVRLPTGSDEEVYPDVMYRIEASGVLKGPGRFGHLGISAYEFKIEKLLSYEAFADTKCNDTN